MVLAQPSLANKMTGTNKMTSITLFLGGDRFNRRLDIILARLVVESQPGFGRDSPYDPFGRRVRAQPKPQDLPRLAKVAAPRKLLF